MAKYQVLSPDGISIAPNAGYRTLKEAKNALLAWIERYRGQGYYSQACYNGYIRHISLTELLDYCEIIKN